MGFTFYWTTKKAIDEELLHKIHRWLQEIQKEAFANDVVVNVWRRGDELFVNGGVNQEAEDFVIGLSPADKDFYCKTYRLPYMTFVERALIRLQAEDILYWTSDS